MNDPATIRRLYGRRQGHKLRIGQAALVEDTLAPLSVPETGALDARVLFGDDRPLELEIGFGAGEHLAGQATMRPETGFIGCEPFLNGVVGALGHVRDRALRSEAAWRDMADRARKTEESRSKREATAEAARQALLQDVPAE